MAVAVGVDGAWAARTTASAVTSPSFSPAAKSLIILDLHVDSSTTTTVNTITPSDSIGLTWTEIGSEQRCGSGGLVKSWWAYTESAQTNMTATATLESGSDDISRQKTCKVTTWTGTAKTSAVVSKAAGTSATNNLTVNVNTAQHGSVIQGTALDWNARGLPTSTDDEQGYHEPALISGLSAHKSAPTSLWGTSVALNFDANGTNVPDWGYKVYEIIPALWVRQIVSGTAANAAISLNTAAGTAVDDILLVLHGNNYYAGADMKAPSGGPSTWNAITPYGDLGSSANSHNRGYWGKVTTGGAQTISIDRTTDEEHSAVLFVIVGADTTNPVDANAGGSNATNSTSHDAPSVSPSSADALLFCSSQTGTAQGSRTFTPPSGMFEHYDANDAGNFGTYTVASERLAASGATGVRTFTVSSAAQMASISIAIKVPSTGSTVSGAATLSGQSGATVTGVPARVGSASASGLAGMTASGVVTCTAQATLSAQSAVTAQGTRATSGSAGLSAQSEMSATALTLADNPLAFSGSASLSVSALVGHVAQVASAGQSNVDAQGVRSTFGSSAPSAGSAMTVSTASAVVGDASATGSAAMSVSNILIARVAAPVLIGRSNVDALAVKTAFSAANADGSSSMSISIAPSASPLGHLLGIEVDYRVGLKPRYLVGLESEYGVSLTWNG